MTTNDYLALAVIFGLAFLFWLEVHLEPYSWRQWVGVLGLAVVLALGWPGGLATMLICEIAWLVSDYVQAR